MEVSIHSGQFYFLPYMEVLECLNDVHSLDTIENLLWQSIYEILGSILKLNNF